MTPAHATAVAHSCPAHRFEVIVDFCDVFSVGIVVDGWNNASTVCFCSVSLLVIRFCGAWVRPLIALLIPTLSFHSLNGMIGSVPKIFCPTSWTFVLMKSPSALALIAAKRIVHKIPIAKKLTTSHENRSSDHPRSKFLNSNSVDPPTRNA